MSTIAFDTLRFTRRLRDSGIPEHQAEAIADAFRDAQLESDLATRQDLAVAVETIRREISEVKAELVRWIIGAGFLQTALIAALILKLIK